MTRDDLPDVPALRSIEPPADGLERLRERLDADDARPSWWRRVTVPALAVAAVTAIVVGWLAIDRGGPPEPRVAATNALADPSISPDFYWVTSRPAAPSVDVPPPALISISEAPHVEFVTHP